MSQNFMTMIVGFLLLNITPKYSLSNPSPIFYKMGDMQLNFYLSSSNMHRVKSVRIRNFSGPYFPAFELNTDRYSVFSLNAG